MAFLSWVILRLKSSEEKHIIPLNQITISLSIFMLIAFIASTIGIEPFENLKRFKGELLIPFILFIITATEFRSLEKIKELLSALLIAFAIYNLFTIIESTEYGLSYYWDKSNREQHYWLTTGYWQRGALLFPVILGMIFFVKNRWLKYFLITFAVLLLVILTAYRSFAVLLGSILVLVLAASLVRPKRYRAWILGFISIYIFLFVLLLHTGRDNPVMAEYREKLEKIINIHREFKSERGFSGRTPAWQAAVDIIKDRPLLGYGWEMKKFTALVQQEKFLKKWKVENPNVYNFFTTYKDVLFPPHNMFLEIALRSGLLGLTSFLIFIGLYVSYIVRRVIHSNSETGYNFLIIIVGGALLSFITTNLMNNELGNISGKILFVILGAGLGKRD